ncbi:MAG: DUF1523 family protein [Micrococcaceae bacterium]
MSRREKRELEAEEHHGRKKKKKMGFFKKLTILLVVVVVLALAGVFGFHYGTAKTETCTVTGSDRTQMSKKSVYRVYTTPAPGSKDRCGTFQIHDTVWYMNFNSSDIYGKLVRGQNYKIKAYGFRNGLFSWFPNIVKVEPGPASTSQQQQ